MVISKAFFSILLVTLSFSLIAPALESASETLPEKYNAEEATWRYSNFRFINLDNLFKSNYCGREARFYLGCLAGLDQFVRLANPKNTLVVTSTELTVEESQQPIPEDDKAYFAAERIRYKEFATTFNPKNVLNIESTYLKYKDIIKTIEPYQVARSVNAAENVIYDIHSLYQPRPRYNAVRVSGKDAIVGFAYGRIKSEVMIFKVVKDMPAEKAGVKSGDVILAFDGVSATNMTEDEIYQATDKKVKEFLALKLRRNKKEFSVKLQFVPPRLPKTIARPIKSGKNKFTYIQFENFMGEGICETVRDALSKAEKNSDGVVLDLRDNPGGRVTEVACILGALIGPGKQLIYEKDIYSEVVLDKEKTTGVQVFTKPLVALINHNSASASEILAGDLQAYGRGLIVGTTSFGKGTEQLVVEIERLERHMTSFIYHLANGVSPQLIGVTPDIVTFVNPEPMELENSVLRERDIGIKPFEATPIVVPQLNATLMTVPEKCQAQKNVVSVYNKLNISDWSKDLQLLNGLAALSCTGLE